MGKTTSAHCADNCTIEHYAVKFGGKKSRGRSRTIGKWLRNLTPARKVPETASPGTQIPIKKRRSLAGTPLN